MKMIKATSIFMFEMIKLLVIGLPIAIILLCTMNLFFELKRIIQWIRN
jgi:hypothetical protein